MRFVSENNFGGVGGCGLQGEAGCPEERNCKGNPPGGGEKDGLGLL